MRRAVLIGLPVQPRVDFTVTGNTRPATNTLPTSSAGSLAAPAPNPRQRLNRARPRRCRAGTAASGLYRISCTVIPNRPWLRSVHGHGLTDVHDCHSVSTPCSLAEPPALTVSQTVPGQSYAVPCHRGWMPVGHTFSLAQ